MFRLESFWAVNVASRPLRTRLVLAVGVMVFVIASVISGYAGTGEPGKPDTKESLKPLAESKENGLLGWITAVGTIVIGGVTIWASFALGRANALVELDQASHVERVKLYPSFVKHTEPFALYFSQTRNITDTACKAIGEELSKWYFELGGLYLSEDSKDAYFILAEALTFASNAGKDLVAPIFPDDAPKINEKTIEKRRKDYGLHTNDLRSLVCNWKFGELDGREFKDFILLQYLSSRLRTELTQDLRSRVRPGGSTQGSRLTRLFRSS